MIDARDQISAVNRRLGLEERDGQEARQLTASQTYDADIDDVWDAVTSAKRIPRWFLPVSGDLRQGGRYQLEGNAGGTILECEPPRRLALTWEYGGTVSWVDAQLTTDPNGATTLELRHTVPVDDHWREFGPGAVGIGWDMALLGLSQHMSGAGPVTPEYAAAWMASAEGKEFMTRSGELWRAADIAAGTDEATATAAAGRCIAAYAGDVTEQQPSQTP